MKTALKSILVGLLLQTVSAGAFAVPVANYSFEDVVIAFPYRSVNVLDVPGWTRAGSAGDAALWRVGYVDGAGSVTVAGDGQQFVTMGGGYSSGGTTTGTTSWEQSIGGLISGQVYLLEFQMAAEAAGGPFTSEGITQTLTASLIGVGTIAQDFTATNNVGNYWRDWETKSLAFTADASSMTLKFSYSGPYDVGLDNVRITERSSVPEPATLALLGVALAGLGFARRRKLH